MEPSISKPNGSPGEGLEPADDPRSNEAQGRVADISTIDKHENESFKIANTAATGVSMTDDQEKDKNKNELADTGKAPPKDWRFWSIIVCLSISSILACIDATIITTSLPSITTALSGGQNYVWVFGAYFATSLAFQPFFGQTANIFGRRNLMIISMAIFTLGSGLCGGASSMNMLIAARAIQGVGGGGINLFCELIVCDLVPLRERGKYTAIVFSTIIIGLALGPFMGGIIVQRSSWRWVFYINLPIGGVVLVLLFFLLRVGYRTEEASFTRVDFIGNIIFIGGCIGLMFALVNGGVVYPWSSWHILVPLIVGVAAIGVFAVFEMNSNWCPEPTMPRQLYGNRTSVAALLGMFVLTVLTVWTTYFLSVYFQAVLLVSPTAAGVDLLPTMLGFMPSATISGWLLAKYGRYRPYHIAGFTILTISYGLFSLLKQSTPIAGWVLLQIFFAIGCGLIMPTLIPAMQAELTDMDTATSVAMISLARSFGSVWGALIPSIIFNNRFDELASSITDQTTRDALSGGHAYAHANNEYLNSLSEVTRSQVVQAFTESLKLVWWVGIAFGGIGIILALIEKEIDLRTEIETDFGIVAKEEKKGSETSA